MHNSIRSTVALQSDILPFSDHLLEQLLGQNYRFEDNSVWWKSLHQKCEVNRKLVKQMVDDTSSPLNYYTVFHHMQELLPKNSIIVSEGANTMDIGRSILLNQLPRHRLDAGTFGTMGVCLFLVNSYN